LLLVAFLLINVPNCHLSLVLAPVVQGDAVNCKRSFREVAFFQRCTLNIGTHRKSYFNKKSLKKVLLSF